MTPAPVLEVLQDAEAVAHRAASVIALHLRESVEKHGHATIALSGGQTPRRMLEFLADEPLPWEAISVLQVDERLAPDGSPDRNASGTQAALANVYTHHTDRFHWMPVTTPDPADAAQRYAKTLVALTGPARTIDIVHLGLGEDGHTASLFPGTPALSAEDDVTVTGVHAGRRRLTLTLPVINRARFIVWVVTGAAKGAALASLLKGDPDIPATAVRRAGALIFADRAAVAPDHHA